MNSSFTTLQTLVEVEVFESVDLILTPGSAGRPTLPLAEAVHQFEIVTFGDDKTDWARFKKNDRFGLKVEGKEGLRDLERQGLIYVTRNGQSYFKSLDA